jgi:hypothetical protein
MGKLFAPKKEEVTSGRRKFHSEKRHNLYSLPSIIKVIKTGMTKWAEHMAPVGWKMYTKF